MLRVSSEGGLIAKSCCFRVECIPLLIDRFEVLVQTDMPVISAGNDSEIHLLHLE